MTLPFVWLAAAAASLGTDYADAPQRCPLEGVRIEWTSDRAKVARETTLPPGITPLDVTAYAFTSPGCRVVFVRPNMRALSPRRRCDVALHELVIHAVLGRGDQYDDPTRLDYGYDSIGSIDRWCTGLIPLKRRPRVRARKTARGWSFTEVR